VLDGADPNCNASKTCSAGPERVSLSATAGCWTSRAPSCGKASARGLCFSFEKAVASSNIVDFDAFDFATDLLGFEAF